MKRRCLILTDSYEYNKDSDENKDDAHKRAVEEIDRHVKHLSRDIRELNESNPHEQAIKFNEIKKNPPDIDFMKVECFHGKDKDGGDVVCSRSINLSNGETRWVEHNPFFVFSPYIGFQANIAKAPLHSMDMLLDEAMNMVNEEKKAFKPEKRKDENNLGWIIFVVLCVLGSIGAAVMLGVRFLSGG